MQLTVRDETASGTVTNELTLDVLCESMTVRDLIRARVYQEVQDYNLRQRRDKREYNGLVVPDDAERALNGVRLRSGREIDFRQQFDKACEAFDRNGFLVLINDHQAQSLDETVTLRHDTKVSFVRLVMLVGG